jgi:Ca2+-binding EF-hand superfamily protein
MDRIPKEKVSAARMEAFEKEMEEMKALTTLFRHYDTNKTGTLEEANVKKLLTDLDNSTPPGTPPTDEELQFIMKVGDQKCQNGCIDRSELKEAILAWRSYIKKREEMQKAIAEHDKSGTGALNAEELKAYLVTLNDGQEVTDEEVQWVLGEADVLGNGVITAPELVKAVNIWYVHVEQQEEEKKAKAKCCVVQ